MINTTPLRKKLLDLAFSGKLVPKTGEWKTVKLGEVGEIVTGSTPPKANRSLYNGDFPFYKPSDLDQGYDTAESLDSLTDEGWRLARHLPAGAVLVTCIGATLGKVGIIRRQGSCNQQINAIVCKQVIPEYLYHSVLSPIFQQKLWSMSNSTTLPLVNKTVFSQLLIPLPPLSEQRAIVSRLEELLALEREIAADSAALDDLIAAAKRKILDLAVAGKLVKKRGEWKTVKLGDVFQHNTGKALNMKDVSGVMMPYLTTSNVYWDRFELETLKKMPFTETEIEKCSVRKGDLLVCEGGDIGRANIWDCEYSVCCQNHLHRLRPIGDVMSRYGYYVLMHYKNEGKIQGKGIGLQGLSSKALHDLEIPLPPLAEQRAIVAKVDELFAVLDAMKD